MEPEIQEEKKGALQPLFELTPLSTYVASALFILMPFLGGYIGYIHAPEKIVEVEKEVVQTKYINSLQESKPGRASGLVLATIAQSNDGMMQYLLRVPYEGGGYTFLYYKKNVDYRSAPDYFNPIWGLYSIRSLNDHIFKINPDQFDQYRNTEGTVNWLVSNDNSKLIFISPYDSAPERCDAPGLGSGLPLGNGIAIVDIDTAMAKVLKPEYAHKNVSYQILNYDESDGITVLKQTHELINTDFPGMEGICADKVLSEEEIVFDTESDFFAI